jgi:hypothetical protein
MAIKILTQIGTDSGITSEAYVRIHEYNISKSGAVNLQLEIYLSEDLRNPVKNKSIGDSLVFDLSHNEIITENKIISATKGEFSPIPPINKEGLTVMPEGINELEENEVTIERIVKVIDLSELESKNIFEFGYEKLKSYLSLIYGKENIVDC